MVGLRGWLIGLLLILLGDEATCEKVASKSGTIDLGSTLSELEAAAKEDPELGQFIAIGRFAQDKLKDVGVAFGDLVGLSSSPTPTDLEKAERASTTPRKRGARYERSQVLTVVEETRNKKGDSVAVEQKYETLVAIDPTSYGPPGVALVSAWRLDEKKAGILERSKKLDVPAPPDPPSFLERTVSTYGKQLTTLFGVILCSALIRFLRAGAKLLYEKRYGSTPSPEDSTESKEREGDSEAKEKGPKTGPARKRKGKKTPKA